MMRAGVVIMMALMLLMPIASASSTPPTPCIQPLYLTRSSGPIPRIIATILSRLSRRLDPTRTLTIRFCGKTVATRRTDLFSEYRILGHLVIPPPRTKWLAFSDSDTYCAADRVADDSPGPDNLNNTTPGAAVISASHRCRNVRIVLHELGHLLGAVQDSAPHSDGTGHCTQGHDIMCHAIDNACSRPAVFDCGSDDYFSLDPAPGSYLDTHWNVADSRYLDCVGVSQRPVLGVG